VKKGLLACSGSFGRKCYRHLFKRHNYYYISSFTETRTAIFQSPTLLKKRNNIKFGEAGSTVSTVYRKVWWQGAAIFWGAEQILVLYEIWGSDYKCWWHSGLCDVTLLRWVKSSWRLTRIVILHL